MFVPREKIQPEKLDELSERRMMAYDSDLMLVEVSLKKNGIGAVHTHPHHQVDYLVSGRVEFNLNGEKRILLPGDSVVIPPNLPHGAFALEDSVLLDIFSPMREDFVKAVRK